MPPAAAAAAYCSFTTHLPLPRLRRSRSYSSVGKAINGSAGDLVQHLLDTTQWLLPDPAVPVSALTVRPDGGGERMLANGFLVEGPTWAPNGRVLAFFRQQPSSAGRPGSVTLHQVDITGRFERQIPTPTDASDPAWSPLIPQ